MKLLAKNLRLREEVDRVAEVAGYLWSKGWAERNGGNISLQLTEWIGEAEKALPGLAPPVCLEEAVPALGGEYFFVTGTGKRMRNVAKDPWANGALIRLSADGRSFEIIAEHPVRPTMELSSHLFMHHSLRLWGRKNRVVLHTHPTELIGMTHQPRFLEAGQLTRTLWGMIPECRMIVPKGVGIVPYQTPGTLALAHATIEQLRAHDIVCWEKHGLLAVGEDVEECFDALDTLNKSAQIYIYARLAGSEPAGLSDEQLEELARYFGL